MGRYKDAQGLGGFYILDVFALVRIKESREVCRVAGSPLLHRPVLPLYPRFPPGRIQRSTILILILSTTWLLVKAPLGS